MMQVRSVTGAEFAAAVPRLAVILKDAVDAGAGVSFLAPLDLKVGADYWRAQSPAIDAGQTVLFVAESDGVILGTVMLLRAWAPNQPHRGDIAKMLVHSAARRRGIGRALLAALEARARAMGLTLLTFDAVAGSAAERFYRSLGYTCAGVIPDYAYSGLGQLDATAIFWKRL